MGIHANIRIHQARPFRVEPMLWVLLLIFLTLWIVAFGFGAGGILIHILLAMTGLVFLASLFFASRSK
jgi:hypothetical protein